MTIDIHTLKIFKSLNLLDESSLDIMNKFVSLLLKENKKYNIISKSTEKIIWHRHILDSLQIVKFINFDRSTTLHDLGSGGGFPGICLSIYNKNPRFHVKMYEKSIVKSNFLKKVIKILNLNAEVINNDVFKIKIVNGYVVARGFKKIDKILKFSRENCQKIEKFIILKGKNAQVEAQKAFKGLNIKYSLKNSITEKDSKILIF